MNTYKHSVSLELSKCIGCTTCLRHCPTEAIRIRNGHAVIDNDRCIDCGECIRVCPHKAKKTLCGSIEEMKNYKWNIALPAPSLYGQFENLEDVDIILDGLLKIGFDDVFEVSAAAEIVSAYTREYLKNESVKKPAISSACPAILRLIELRFPSLTENIIHMLPPMEVAAGMARKRALSNNPELKSEDIGIFFISPCPAKVSYVNNGFGAYKSQVDVVVPIRELYFLLIGTMKESDDLKPIANSGKIGISWASSGGESTAIFNDDYLAADGIDNCIHVLEQIDNGAIANLEFVELNACTGGCVGGVMNIQNPFIAKARLRSLRRYLPVSCNFLEQGNEIIPEEFLFESFPDYRPIAKLSDSFSESLRMMSKITEIKESLPGIDCGSCGAPTCRAFAEDIVKNNAKIEDCPILNCKNK